MHLNVCLYYIYAAYTSYCSYKLLRKYEYGGGDDVTDDYYVIMLLLSNVIMLLCNYISFQLDVPQSFHSSFS